MTSIPASSLGSAAPAGEGAGASGTADPAGGEGGFMALISSLLQATAPAAGSATPALQAAVTAEVAGPDEDLADADALLAAMGLLPGAATPLPRSALPAEGGTAQRGGALPAIAAGQAGVGQAPAGAAGALAAEALFAAVEEAAVDAAAGDDPGTARSDSDADPGPSPWAAAAGRTSQGQDAARAAATAAEGALREPVGSPRWRDELGAQLTMMAAGGKQSGSLRLSPEHLGPLEIQIDVAGDRSTTVQFGAQSAETRAALQDALPRLREMFEAAGLQLADAGVSGDAPRSRPEDAPSVAGQDGAANDGEPSSAAAPVRTVTHRGLLDTYA